VGEPGNSVSIVSDYGLDDRDIEVRSPAEARGFFSNLCVQTGSGTHPASCTMGTGGPFPGAEALPGLTLITHHHLVPRSRMSRSFTSSPPQVGLLYLFNRAQFVYLKVMKEDFLMLFLLRTSNHATLHSISVTCREWLTSPVVTAVVTVKNGRKFHACARITCSNGYSNGAFYRLSMRSS
jgi:hypothetical protein